MTFIAGVDEVGRGCLAGPVIAAAVVLKTYIPDLTDSKKLSKKKREELSSTIMQNSYFSFGSASVEEIDSINILQASLVAMKRAILNLSIKPGKILVDGTHKPDLDIDTQTIIGGDSNVYEISAASIIAKVYRDNLMIKLSEKFSNYAWESNFGYGTKAHLDGLKKYGVTSHHRKGFKPIHKILSN